MKNGLIKIKYLYKYLLSNFCKKFKSQKNKIDENQEISCLFVCWLKFSSNSLFAYPTHEINHLKNFFVNSVFI